MLGVTIVGAMVITFVLVRIVPGDPIDVLAGQYGGTLTSEEQDALRADLGLDRSLLGQFWIYVARFFRGDLGISFRTRRSVAELIGPRVVPSLVLAGVGLTIGVLFSIPLGIIAATHRNTWIDYFANVSGVIWVSVPNFWFALLLMYFLAFRWRLFPVFGAGIPGNIPSLLHHLALPAMVVGLRSAGMLVRMTRSCVLDVLDSEYVRAARAKGLNERVVLYKHVLRNAGIPLVTLMGIIVAYSLASQVIIESVFARQGLGKLLIDSMFARDYTTVQGVTILLALAVAVINFLVDMLYACIDPRLRY